MPKFYIKNESGDFEDGDSAVDALFREKSDSIMKERLPRLRDQVRKEIEEDVRKQSSETIKKELRGEIEAEYKVKLDESESKAKELSTALLRKTIAAEYGFKPETEEFLGNGSEDDMRSKADLLKNSFGGSATKPAMEKTTTTDTQDSFVKLNKD